MLLKRMENVLDENQQREQASFRKAYSTVDLLQTINQHIEKNYMNSVYPFASDTLAMIIIIIIVIIIIIIAFKGAIRDFLQSPHSAANCLQHARSSGPGAIVCKSRATHRALITCKCHVTCHLVRRDSSAIKFDRVEITFIWALFYWLSH